MVEAEPPGKENRRRPESQGLSTMCCGEAAKYPSGHPYHTID
jgi:hypothetical protein